MQADLFRGLPPYPADVAEWEELLLRFELGPRALRFVLEDLDPLPSPVLESLNHLVTMELWTAGALEAMRTGEVVRERVGLSHADPREFPAAVRKRLQEYVALRSDNFGGLQRRGLEVWDWSAKLEGGGAVSAYQAVRRALQIDAEVLAAVRGAGGMAR